jgi:hypothetical protein
MQFDNEPESQINSDKKNNPKNDQRELRARSSRRAKKPTNYFHFVKCHCCKKEDCCENLLGCKNELCGLFFCLRCIKTNMVKIK